MSQKRQYKTYTKAFKKEAVALVIEQDYTVPDTAHISELKLILYRCTKALFKESR